MCSMLLQLGLHRLLLVALRHELLLQQLLLPACSTAKGDKYICKVWLCPSAVSVERVCVSDRLLQMSFMAAC